MANVISEFGTIVSGSDASMQYYVMPPYTDKNPGDIVQYLGVTNADYTNGYFYKRGQYGWENVSVQETDMSAVISYINSNILGGGD